MTTEVIPAVVGALSTIKKGMVENMKKVSECYCDRDPKDSDLHESSGRCLVYEQND